MSQLSFSRNDRGNRRRALDLLMKHEGEWVSSLELQLVAGLRFGARVHELRSAGHVIDCDGAEGHYSYRWRGLGLPPLRTSSWRTRALVAEARVRELEQRLGGQH